MSKPDIESLGGIPHRLYGSDESFVVDVPDDDVRAVLATMERSRVLTGEEFDDGVPQMVPVLNSNTGEARRVVWQGRGIGAWFEDEANQNVQNAKLAAFGATVAAGIGRGLYGSPSAADVMIVGAPGAAVDVLGLDGPNGRNKLTVRQRRALKMGETALIAQATAVATFNALVQSGQHELPFDLIGASASTDLATFMVPTLLDNGVKLETLSLIEPVGLMKRNALVGAAQFASSSFGAEYILKGNSPVFDGAEGAQMSVRESMAGFLRGSALPYARAAFRGATLNPLLLSRDVVGKMNDQGTVVHFVYAQESEFPGIGRSVEEAAKRLEEAGHESVEITKYELGRHAICSSSLVFINSVTDAHGIAA